MVMIHLHALQQAGNVTTIDHIPVIVEDEAI